MTWADLFLMFRRWRAWRATVRFARQYAYRTRRPWSFGESRWRLDWIERNYERHLRVLMGLNPWHVHCGHCLYDLDGVPPNHGGRSKDCPECHERTLLPSWTVNRRAA